MCFVLALTDFTWPTFDWSYAMRAPFLHFALGFLAAWLPSRLILTMLRSSSVTPTEELRMRRYLFWLALSAAIASHVLEDWYVGWF